MSKIRQLFIKRIRKLTSMAQVLSLSRWAVRSGFRSSPLICLKRASASDSRCGWGSRINWLGVWPEMDFQNQYMKIIKILSFYQNYWSCPRQPLAPQGPQWHPSRQHLRSCSSRKHWGPQLLADPFAASQKWDQSIHGCGLRRVQTPGIYFSD